MNEETQHFFVVLMFSETPSNGSMVDSMEIIDAEDKNLFVTHAHLFEISFSSK